MGSCVVEALRHPEVQFLAEICRPCRSSSTRPSVSKDIPRWGLHVLSQKMVYLNVLALAHRNAGRVARTNVLWLPSCFGWGISWAPHDRSSETSAAPLAWEDSLIARVCFRALCLFFLGGGGAKSAIIPFRRISSTRPYHACLVFVRWLFCLALGIVLGLLLKRLTSPYVASAFANNGLLCFFTCDNFDPSCVKCEAPQLWHIGPSPLSSPR